MCMCDNVKHCHILSPNFCLSLSDLVQDGTLPKKSSCHKSHLDLVNMDQTNDETDSVPARFNTLLPRTGACTSIWSTWLAARWLAFCTSSEHSRRNLNMAVFLFNKTFGHDTIFVLICTILQELIYRVAMSRPAVCWSAKPVQNCSNYKGVVGHEYETSHLSLVPWHSVTLLKCGVSWEYFDVSMFIHICGRYLSIPWVGIIVSFGL